MKRIGWRISTKRGSNGANEIGIRRLGRVDYADALELQRDLVERRKQGLIPDQLLLLEHPDVITFGVRSRNDRSHLLATPEALAAEGVSVFETGRGGDVTFHGPGQLVGYPIFDLKPDRCDVHRYVRDLEEALIRAVGEFGIRAGRVKGLTGIWVGPDGREAKLAAPATLEAVGGGVPIVDRDRRPRRLVRYQGRGVIAGGVRGTKTARVVAGEADEADQGAHERAGDGKSGGVSRAPARMVTSERLVDGAAPAACLAWTQRRAQSPCQEDAEESGKR